LHGGENDVGAAQHGIGDGRWRIGDDAS
jgi:hypothetical protein